jgi:uncharacterized protein
MMHHERVAAELGLKIEQIAATAALLAQDATVPFIARYRKEATGSLDEVQIAAINDRLAQLAEFDKRREAIRKSLRERGLMTDELDRAIAAAETLAQLEDIYLPYRPKRRTRAMIARERGLEPLAELLLHAPEPFDPQEAAAPFVDAGKEVEDAAAALAGARDILAERFSEAPESRRAVRELFGEQGVLASTVAKDKEETGAKFRDYFAWSEPLAKAPSHRILALFRGEKEEALKLSIRPPEERALALLERLHLRRQLAAGEQIRLAIADGYQRLLAPSIENEWRAELKLRADAEAIRVFTQNLRELLMAAPLGQKQVLGIDPGFRTGCKVVCLDAQGRLLEDTVIYPAQSAAQVEAAGQAIRELVARHRPQAIAIGNGTASRETEQFVRGLGLPSSIAVVMVNEAGASVYSASAVARREFPDKDVTVRGAVSIGRRLMDPLAELVKIDPKAIGVGQYQHDVDQGALKTSLDQTVESCVNRVGVEVNTASCELLAYVSGLGPSLATNIVKHRDEFGPFASRAALKKVPRLGPKAFEQAAGFLRIREARNPLDGSAVHPERYQLVDRMAGDLGCTVVDLMRDSALRERISLDRYVDAEVGRPTLQDILSELARPGRDPREAFVAFAFAEGVHTLDDLAPGMKLPGIVTNVTAFGAFVDVGVHQDGLVHISELSDSFVSDPASVVKVQQHVTVTVLGVDRERNRISLSMKSRPGERRPKADSTARPADNRPGPAKERPEPRRSGPAPEKAGESNWFLDALKEAQAPRKK